VNSSGLQFVVTLVLVVLAARLLGATARRFRQPAVAGEILAGVVLGPSGLGLAGPSPTLDFVARFAVGLFLLSAGMEVDLSTVRREGRTAVVIGVAGLAFPFALGFAVASLAPDVLSIEPRAPTNGAIFFGIAMAISALPVIARTLMNLSLYRTDFGMTVIAAAVLDDIVGWSLFALLVARVSGASDDGLGVAWTIPLVVILAALMLTIVRRGIDRTLPSVSGRAGAGGVVAVAASVALVVGLLAQWIGVHAVFGAFLTGIAFGDSCHMPDRSRAILGGAVERLFAPLFFGSIGLEVNVARDFDPRLCAVVLGLACAGKLLACSLGARLAGIPPRRAWAFGFAMNSRGAMEIVLGMLALDAGLIGPPLFVALVLMALVTSVASGPAIARLLGPTIPLPRH
jgi:Kef-type K+ transport system membrane component KefB